MEPASLLAVELSRADGRRQYEAHEVRLAVHAELRVQIPHMPADRALLATRGRHDLVDRPALRQERRDLTLGPRQVVCLRHETGVDRGAGFRLGQQHLRGDATRVETGQIGRNGTGMEHQRTSPGAVAGGPESHRAADAVVAACGEQAAKPGVVAAP